MSKRHLTDLLSEIKLYIWQIVENTYLVVEETGIPYNAVGNIWPYEPQLILPGRTKKKRQSKHLRKEKFESNKNSAEKVEKITNGPRKLPLKRPEI